MTQPPLGVAVVGAGYWGPNLVRNFLASDDTSLWAVCDTDLERASRAAGRHISIIITDALATVLADERIEAVAIATPVRTHHAIALASLRPGQHVLIEQPLESTAPEGRALTAIGRAHVLTPLP